MSTSVYPDDPDSKLMQFLYFPMVMILNSLHTYMMYKWNNNWANLSWILIVNTAIHYVQSFFSVLIMSKDNLYLYKYKDWRILSLTVAWTTIGNYLLSIILEVYLLFFSQNVAAFFLALYMGYVLLMSITILPESLAIISVEAKLNIFERNDDI